MNADAERIMRRLNIDHYSTNAVTLMVGGTILALCSDNLLALGMGVMFFMLGCHLTNVKNKFLLDYNKKYNGCKTKKRNH
jgi:hypothetical protein